MGVRGGSVSVEIWFEVRDPAAMNTFQAIGIALANNKVNPRTSLYGVSQI